MNTAGEWHKAGETLADRILKVNHAGEHGAVCIYLAQRFVARWRAPELLNELDAFLLHERRHRSVFAGELQSRGRRRCRSYWLCAAGGSFLGTMTGILGAKAISATTVAIERVVTRHLQEQLILLGQTDLAAVNAIESIVADEQAHLVSAARRVGNDSILVRAIDKVVSFATEMIILVGMKL